MEHALNALRPPARLVGIEPVQTASPTAPAVLPRLDMNRWQSALARAASPRAESLAELDDEDGHAEAPAEAAPKTAEEAHIDIVCGPRESTVTSARTRLKAAHQLATLLAAGGTALANDRNGAPGPGGFLLSPRGPADISDSVAVPPSPAVDAERLTLGLLALIDDAPVLGDAAESAAHGVVLACLTNLSGRTAHAPAIARADAPRLATLIANALTRPHLSHFALAAAHNLASEPALASALRKSAKALTALATATADVSSAHTQDIATKVLLQLKMGDPHVKRISFARGSGWRSARSHSTERENPRGPTQFRAFLTGKTAATARGRARVGVVAPRAAMLSARAYHGANPYDTTPRHDDIDTETEISIPL